MRQQFVLGFVLLNLTDCPTVLIRALVQGEMTAERKGLGKSACRQLTATSSHIPCFRDANAKLAAEVVALVFLCQRVSFFFFFFSRSGEYESNCT